MDDSAHFEGESRVEENEDLRSILAGLNEAEETAERNLEKAGGLLLEMENAQEMMQKKLKELINELENTC